MRVFLDANILFSAAHRAENSVRVFFRLGELGTCELIASAFAVDEARRNIARKPPARLPDLETLLASVSICEEAGAEDLRWARLTCGMSRKARRGRKQHTGQREAALRRGNVA